MKWQFSAICYPESVLKPFDPYPLYIFPTPREISTTLENRRFVFLSAVQSLFHKFLLPTAILTRIFFSPQSCKLKNISTDFFINSYFVLFNFCLYSLGEMFAASFFEKKIITNVMFKSKTLFT